MAFVFCWRMLSISKLVSLERYTFFSHWNVKHSNSTVTVLEKIDGKSSLNFFRKLNFMFKWHQAQSKTSLPLYVRFTNSFAVLWADLFEIICFFRPLNSFSIELTTEDVIIAIILNLCTLIFSKRSLCCKLCRPREKMTGNWCAGTLLVCDLSTQGLDILRKDYKNSLATFRLVSAVSSKVKFPKSSSALDDASSRTFVTTTRWTKYMPLVPNTWLATLSSPTIKEKLKLINVALW